MNTKSVITFTTELDQYDSPVSYCIAGDIVDHDGHLFPVAEFSFKQTKAWDTLMYYTQNFDNVLVRFETKKQASREHKIELMMNETGCSRDYAVAYLMSASWYLTAAVNNFKANQG